MANGYDVAMPYLATLTRDQINFHWLILLRWAAVAGQLLTILTTYFVLKIDVAFVPLLGLVMVGALSNSVLHFMSYRKKTNDGDIDRSLGEVWMGAVMVLDILLLSAVLYLSGGPTNPFSVFYIVNISLSAAVLNARWAWGLTILAVLCFSMLFVRYVPVAALEHGPSDEHAHHEHHHANVSSHSMHLHLRGMLVAFAGAAIFVTYFVTRVSAELREQDRALAEAERRKAKAEKLDSLITLAAGAAHELATPLSTIAVIARELEFGFSHPNQPGPILDEIRLIRSEIERCRNILNAMSARSGENRGESWQVVTVPGLLDAAIAPLQERYRLEWKIAVSAQSLTLRIPLVAVEQSIRSIVKNAIDASQHKEGFISLTAESQENMLLIAIEDHGVGISSSILERIGEPFFTTKPTGEGMGLGLFLARRVSEQLGGSLKVDSRYQHGTRVEMLLPCLGIAIV